MIKLVMILVLALSLTGCSSLGKSLRSLFGGSTEEPVATKKRSQGTRFSDSQSVPYSEKNRNYQRMTREQFEEDAQIHANQEGSLWVMEGQGSYLFSSNTLRLVGDIVNVKLDGSPKSQLETKVKVIKDLLAKLDKPKRKPAAVKPAQAAPGAAPAAAVAATDGAKPESDATPAAGEEKKDDSPGFEVGTVPARIVERTMDGNYRVKGAQTFMIGKREYKVIVTGMVRGNDINGDEVNAPALLEPKFDIVSMKKELKL